MKRSPRSFRWTLVMAGSALALLWLVLQAAGGTTPVAQGREWQPVAATGALAPREPHTDTLSAAAPVTVALEISGTAAATTTVSAQEAAAAELSRLFARELELAAVSAMSAFGAFDEPAAFPITSTTGEELWVVHTTGMRSFDPDVPHVLAVYRQKRGDWTEVARYDFVSEDLGDQIIFAPDYLAADGVDEVALAPGKIFLHVEGGAGAHSGICDILSFDGEQISSELAVSAASPGVCQVRDVNGDRRNDVMVDATDPYVFCYACGVRLPLYAVWRWSGQALAQVTLQPLPATAPAALVESNDEVLRLVEGGFWKGALASAERALARGRAPGIYGWNMALIQLTGAARRDQANAPEHPYPLLAQLFYGDYPAAVAIMREYTVTELFAQPSALVSGTVAEGWEDTLAAWITATVEPALEVRPRLAEAHFLRGWARWLVGEAGYEQDLARAARFAPADPLFATAVAWAAGETAAGQGAGQAEIPVAEPATAARPATARAASGPGRLFYSAPRDGVDTVFTLDLAESEPPAVAVIDQASQPALQPGGVRLALHSSRDDMLGLNAFDIDTELRFQLTFNFEDALPRWNPAGNRLVFSSLRYGDGRSRVYVVWADGRSEAEDLREGADPDWSPDGSRLVYKGCDAQGAACGLWTMNPDGTDRRPLTDNPGDARPRWAPDGASVAFMSDQRDGNWDVYVVDVASGAVERITFNDADDGLPAFSPDGTELAFVSDRGGRWGIWRVAAGGGVATLLVEDIGELPSWLDQALDWAP